MKFYNCFFFFYFFLFFPFSFYKKIFYLQPVQVFALVQVSKNKMFLERKSRNISVKSFVTNRNTIFSLFTYTKYKYMILAIFFEKRKKEKKAKKSVTNIIEIDYHCKGSNINSTTQAKSFFIDICLEILVLNLSAKAKERKRKNPIYIFSFFLFFPHIK